MMWLYSMQQAQLWPGLTWSAHWSVQSHLYTDLAIVGESAGFHMNSSSMATILVSYRTHESTVVVLKWSEWRTSHLPKTQLNHSFLSKAFSRPQRLLICLRLQRSWGTWLIWELQYAIVLIFSPTYGTSVGDGWRREIIRIFVDFSNHKHLCNCIKTFLHGLSEFCLPRPPFTSTQKFYF